MKTVLKRPLPCRSKIQLQVLAAALLLLLLLSGPAATRLQSRAHHADAREAWDAVYLVCGARAQQLRLEALTRWLDTSASRPARILIGNDTQNSLWSREHQRNLTRAEWAYHAMQNRFADEPDVQVLIPPGNFSNTDGEMQALAHYLREHPDIQALALVTSPFHARRTLLRFSAYAPGHIHIAIVPGTPHWENRAPWIVAAEWLKILRDQINLSQHPWLSRQATPHPNP